MSLEQSIATLTAQAGLLLDLPQTITDEALAQIQAVGADYQAILTSQSKLVYINQLTGLDTNAGTALAPMKTITAAVDLVPFGGVCYIRLMAGYDMSLHDSVRVMNRFVHITSDGSVRHSLSFNEYVSPLYTPTLRHLNGFILDGFAAITIQGLTLNWPQDALAGSGFAKTNTGLFTSGNAKTTSVCIRNCDIFIPASSPFPLFNSTDMATLIWISNVMKAGSQAVNGLIHAAHTSTAGIDPLTLRLIRTNLSLI